MVRDGRDVLVSYAHYARAHGYHAELESFEDTLRMLATSEKHFGGWSENIRSWIDRKGPTVIVHFEDLVENPEMVVKNAFSELGVDVGFTGKSIPSFEILKKKMPHFFRSGKVGGWCQEMTPEIESEFWHHHGHMMERLGYDR